MTAWRLFIAEDEPPARERLLEALARVAPQARVAGWSDSVRGTAQWLAGHEAPDLLLLDIRLADGLSLELFRETGPAVPVIFTTAYDQFALQAFQALAVDYLLKPVSDAALAAAFDKARRLKQTFAPDLARLVGLLDAAATPRSPASAATGAHTPPQRLLGRLGQRFQALPLADAAYAVSVDKLSVLVARDGTRLRLDEPLGDLAARLEPAGWFRASRQLLLSPQAVRSFAPAGRGRLRVLLQPAGDDELLISAERAAAFRAWMAG